MKQYVHICIHLLLAISVSIAVIHYDDYYDVILIDDPTTKAPVSTTTAKSKPFVLYKTFLKMENPAYLRLTRNESVFLNCTIIGSVPVKLYWLHIDESGKENILNFINGKKYNTNEIIRMTYLHPIRCPKASDAGNYSVVAVQTDGVKVVSSSIVVDVNNNNFYDCKFEQKATEPAISLFARDVYAQMEQTVTIPCRVSGCSLPAITWWFQRSQSQRLVRLYDTTPDMEFLDNGEIRIQNVSESKTGFYTCKPRSCSRLAPVTTRLNLTHYETTINNRIYDLFSNVNSNSHYVYNTSNLSAQ